MPFWNCAFQSALYNMCPWTGTLGSNFRKASIEIILLSQGIDCRLSYSRYNKGTATFWTGSGRLHFVQLLVYEINKHGFQMVALHKAPMNLMISSVAIFSCTNCSTQLLGISKLQWFAPGICSEQCRWYKHLLFSLLSHPRCQECSEVFRVL